MEEFKPCPFCGSEFISETYDTLDDVFSCDCDECGVKGPVDRGSGEMAIHRWNERVSE